MRFFQLLAAAGLAAPLVSAWTFKDASLSITEKAGTLQTESFSTSKKLAEAVSLPITATARFRFVIESEEGGRSIPHQTYIQISDPSTGLETSFPADVRDNGRSRVDIEYKLIPKALLGPDKPLLCKLIIGSFGTEESLIAEIGTIVPQFKGEPSPSPLRFGPRPEIIHIFKSDPRYISESVASIVSFSVVALGVLLLGVVSIRYPDNLICCVATNNHLLSGSIWA
ncbi:hypothetical protein BZA70DRAFT_277183 [Myxozyma melibiosi]|uniref:Dolichyl-diphosphooligosaccharide--protein glycosyltransferase subunit 2 n=1 Tax=Myxozyma melibiosi TaxID=54550 RepID=A0ABR1F7M6_9ASCO